MKRKKLSKPPEELQKMFDYINLLPDKDETQSILEKLNDLLSSYADDDGVIQQDYSEDGYNYAETVSDLLGQTIVAFLFSDLSFYDYFRANNRLNRLFAMRDIFHSIAEKNNHFRTNESSIRDFAEGATFVKNSDKYKNLSKEGKESLELVVEEKITETKIKLIKHLGSIKHFYVHTRFTVNSDGNIKPEENEFTSLFNKYDVSFERIRICPICSSVFWAKRIESSTCSNRKCSNNFHQRKRRIKDYEERLVEESKKLGKLQKNLSPKNNLVTKQSKMVEELSKKIEVEKNKNGNL